MAAGIAACTSFPRVDACLQGTGEESDGSPSGVVGLNGSDPCSKVRGPDYGLGQLSQGLPGLSSLPGAASTGSDVHGLLGMIVLMLPPAGSLLQSYVDSLGC